MKKVFERFVFTFIVVVSLAFFMLSNHLAGWRMFIVTSGSMEPAIGTGSVVLTQAITPSLLRSGDVITYIKPDAKREFITHRVVRAFTHQSTIVITTKGDNNNKEDIWKVAGGSVVGQVRYTVPLVGYLLAFLQSKIGVLLFIIFPALYLMVGELGKIMLMYSLWRKKAFTKSTVITFSLVCFTLTCQTSPTYAKLTDASSLTTNTFTITQSVVPTSKPGIIISGNGNGSTNTVVQTNTNGQEIHTDNVTEVNVTINSVISN